VFVEFDSEETAKKVSEMKLKSGDVDLVIHMR
jgi:hypothetical protein